MNEEQLKECTAKVANGMNRALCVLLDQVDNPARRCTAIMTVAFALNTVLAMHLGGPTRFNANNNKLPGPDDHLLSSLLTAQSSELDSTGKDAAEEFHGHAGSYVKAIVEFSPMNILAALEHFKTLTGRDGHDLLNPTLWACIQEATQIDPDGYGPLGGKFFQN